MSTVILLRHGRSTANNKAVLAGRTPGVDLDETGQRQAAALVTRLADVPIARVVSSPLLRCQRTVAPFAEARGLTVETDEQLAEVDYGDWTGRRLSDLATEELWRTVQIHPSAAQFPGGEALAAVSARAAHAARQLSVLDGDNGAVVLCSHGDIIKAILADALGMHLDSFQRLMVSPGSVSVVHYSAVGVIVERINDTATLAGVGSPPQAKPPTQSQKPSTGSASGPSDPATDGADTHHTVPAGHGTVGGDTGRSDDS